MMFVSPGAYRKSSHCGYCDGYGTSLSFGFHLQEKLTLDNYQTLIDRGFRRSGVYVYKPDLKHSCCPQYTIRLEVDKFIITKEHRQIVNRFNRYIGGEKDNGERKGKGKNNQKFNLIDSIHLPELDLSNQFQVRLEPNKFTKEKFELYKLYQTTVHNDEEDEVTEDGFKRFLCADPFVNGNDRFGAFHQLYYHKGKLIAIGVLDILPKCVSSVYLIWHPDYASYGLGKLSVLREISLSLEYQLEYYYMGFYIHNCQKMRYKGLYNPSYLLDPDFGDNGQEIEWNLIDRYKKKLETRKYVSLKGREEGDENDENEDDYSKISADDDFDSDSSLHVIDAKMPGTLDRKQLNIQLKLSKLDLKQIPIIFNARYGAKSTKVTYHDLTPQSQPFAMEILEDMTSALGVELMKKASIVL